MTREEIFQNSQYSLTLNKRMENFLLKDLIPGDIFSIINSEGQKGIPIIAKKKEFVDILENIAQTTPSSHFFYNQDCRSMEVIPDRSVHLVVTSPPYWNLKEYPFHDAQLGSIDDYTVFLNELDRVWEHVYRVLVPGGRLIIVVGDVCVPRRTYGRHLVFPLHASIQERCRILGYDNLSPIIWHKISNAKFEAVGNGGTFLGKPYEPNAIIKNDIEYILFQRKPGGYRSPTIESRLLSIISEPLHKLWFNQIWDIKGASTKLHPAPYPIELAERLIRMYSFVGDTVLDPFAGTGSTSIASAKWGRNSINFEIDSGYFKHMTEKFQKQANSQQKIVQ